MLNAVDVTKKTGSEHYQNVMAWGVLTFICVYLSLLFWKENDLQYFVKY